jgi:group I intron endonuclease
VDVYLIENLVNGMRYVGKTTQSTRERWREHRTEAKIGRKNTPLLCAIREHGPENFKVTVLATRDSQDKLASCERRWIAEYETKDPAKGYNVQGGGGGCKRKPRRLHRTPGMGLTQECRDKLAAATRAYWKRKKEGNIAWMSVTSLAASTITEPDSTPATAE